MKPEQLLIIIGVIVSCLGTFMVLFTNAPRLGIVTTLSGLVVIILFNPMDIG